MFKLIKKIIILICGLCFSVFVQASTRLIIKYKPTNAQTNLVTSSKVAAANVRLQMMQPLSSSRLTRLSSEANAKITDSHALATGAHVIFVDNDSPAEVDAIIKKIESDPEIAYVVKDRLFTRASADITPNPTYQWDMYGAGEFMPKPSWIGDGFYDAWQELIQAENSLSGYMPGQGTVVAVIDTGYTPHPNFLNQLEPFDESRYGYQMISDCRIAGTCPTSTLTADAGINYQPDGLDLGDYTSQTAAANYQNNTGNVCGTVIGADSSWHGSHVTGTIVANSYNANSSYITGGAYGAKVVPVRVLGVCGGLTSDIENAIVWASGSPVPNTINGSTMINGSANKADVINLSLGGSGSCDNDLQDAINIAIENGSIIVVAAGNEKQNVSNSSPANCNGVVSVAARGPTNKLASYSNYGNVTIAASGGDCFITNCVGYQPLVYSTIWSSNTNYIAPPTGMGIFGASQGTSQAAPHVAAALADLISYFKANNESYTPSGVVQILTDTASSYTATSFYGTATGGALNVESAVSYAIMYGASNVLSSSAPAGGITFSAPNMPVTITFSNTKNQAIELDAPKVVESGEVAGIFAISEDSTCINGTILNPVGTTGDSCNIIISVGIAQTASGVLDILDSNGYTIATTPLSYTAPNPAPEPVPINSGGCTMVKGSGDIGLLMLLLLTAIYSYYNRRRRLNDLKNK